MSDYAKITTRLNCQTRDGGRAVLHGVSIRNVRIDDDGRYGFEALIRGIWYVFSTLLDLPTFTDREKSMLIVGRPPLHSKRMTYQLNLKLTADQFAHIERCASAVDERPAQFIRRVLIAYGMPV